MILPDRKTRYTAHYGRTSLSSLSPIPPRAVRALCFHCIIPSLTDNLSFYHQHGTRLLPCGVTNTTFPTPLGNVIPIGPQIKASHTGPPQHQSSKRVAMQAQP